MSGAVVWGLWLAFGTLAVRSYAVVVKFSQTDRTALDYASTGVIVLPSVFAAWAVWQAIP